MIFALLAVDLSHGIPAQQLDSGCMGVCDRIVSSWYGTHHTLEGQFELSNARDEQEVHTARCLDISDTGRCSSIDECSLSIIHLPESARSKFVRR